VLLLVVGLGLVHRDRGEQADAARRRVVALDENRIVKLTVRTADELVRPELGGEQLVRRLRVQALHIVEIGADHGQLAARDNEALVYRQRRSRGPSHPSSG
jgi:hypothetical protein